MCQLPLGTRAGNVRVSAVADPLAPYSLIYVRPKYIVV